MSTQHADNWDGAATGGEGAPAEDSRWPDWLRDTPYWTISALLHLALLLSLAAIILDDNTNREKKSDVTVRVAQKPPQYDPLAARDVKKAPAILAPRIDQPIIQKKLDEITPEIPRGTDLQNYSNFELDYNSINTAIGLAGGAAGAYGERWGKGSLIREGGSQATEEAVRAALEWLKRHQHPDGSWKAHEFTQQCKSVCRNKNSKKFGDGRGSADYDVGVTGLAILAFAGYGHTHRDGLHPEYVECLRKAVKFLKGAQVRSNDPNVDGRFGKRKHHAFMYDHSIATMAMAELLVMSNDIIVLKAPVTNAVRFILHARNDHSAWRYDVRSGENDSSVTGWMVLALKTAKSARLGIDPEEISTALRDALRFYNQATADDGRTGYTKPGQYNGKVPCMTAVGVLCRLFAGEKRSSQTVRLGVEHLIKSLPVWDENRSKLADIYYWYYGSYSLFQFGSKPWRDWNVDMQKALLNSQRRGNIDEDGSWDPIGPWGRRAGRVYSTSLGAMTLEVYYRFRRSRQGTGFLR